MKLPLNFAIAAVREKGKKKKVFKSISLSYSGEFGLWLDGDLYHGRSHSCKTFGNPMLSAKEDFFVQDIEIWSFE